MGLIEIDRVLIDAYIKSFLGYGNKMAKYWLIGMEEGGSDQFEKVYKDITEWKENGAKEFSDILEGSTEKNCTPDVKKYFFDNPVIIQKTWNKLIRLLLTIDHEIKDINEIREFQKHHLGRSDGDNSLIEFFPLPNVSIADWIYEGKTSLKFLNNRKELVREMAPVRIERIRDKIKIYKPKVVVFYSTTPAYMKFWKQIVGSDLKFENGKKYSVQVKDRVLYAVIPHPNSRGVTNSDYENLGFEIRELLNHLNNR
jgi:hypothetical protein